MIAKQLSDMLTKAKSVPRDYRLIVMAQNPSDNYHWSKGLLCITAGELVDVLTVSLAVADIVETNVRDEIEAVG